MKIEWQLGLLAAGVALLLLGATKSAVGPGNIVVVGDSLGLGVGPALKRLGAPNVRVIAVKGTRAAWWAEGTRWEEALQGARTAVVSLGSNDIAGGKSPWSTLQDLDTRARRMGVRVLWLVPSTDLWAKQTVVVPGEALSLAGAEPAADGVHLTARGYAQAALLVKNRLGIKA